ncbi:MAG TPA: DMT family transporter [Burkholderiaceae bacterium]|nr:DMT family transporter [Burkholderiaceae bacterium]
MFPGLTPRSALLLSTAPLLWAGNAVVGRLMSDQLPPITFNLMRWLTVLVLLWPLASWVLRRDSPLWTRWRRMALLGFLGMGCYNALQYVALKTSTPLNVTLVASSSPIFMLGLGRLFFGAAIHRRQWWGVLLSTAGVLTVLTRGELSQLGALRLVPGDVLMLLATATWSWYSWLLIRPPAQQPDPAALRGNWSAWLMAQVLPGVLWSSLFTGLEWTLMPGLHIQWGWPLALALVYVALGPSILAYYCWGNGVAAAGPQVAGFFVNLTPLFAALLSAAVLGEWPHLYHGVAFALIVGGIVVSSGRR